MSQHERGCCCNRCCERRKAKRLRAKYTKWQGPTGTGDRTWSKEMTLAAISTYSDETIAELFWIGHEKDRAEREARRAGA